MDLDNGLDTLDAGQARGDRGLSGCFVSKPHSAIGASTLYILLLAGTAQMDHHVDVIPATQLQATGTLTDLSEIWSTAVVYYLPRTNRWYTTVVSGSEVLTASGSPAKATDAEIEAALPEGAQYLRAGSVRFKRVSSAVTIEEIDHHGRAFGVDPAEKDPATKYAAGAPGVYRPWGSLVFSMPAAALADGDVITDRPLPNIDGKVVAGRIICTQPITTAAKTCTLTVEINATAIDSMTDVYAGTKAQGAIDAMAAPTDNNTFAPGDNITIVGASTTPFVEGHIQIEIDIEERIPLQG